ncbi:hypothetical protein SDC9_210200 [bioreactor metagenome]|uniref:Uncharacterized protein n=1 Tax=bioreactor metagenome TaxID=1076179 RepID=A0A645JFS0_9ZZZZ
MPCLVIQRGIDPGRKLTVERMCGEKGDPVFGRAFGNDLEIAVGDEVGRMAAVIIQSGVGSGTKRLDFLCKDILDLKVGRIGTEKQKTKRFYRLFRFKNGGLWKPCPGRRLEYEMGVRPAAFAPVLIFQRIQNQTVPPIGRGGFSLHREPEADRFRNFLIERNQRTA